MRIAYFFQRDAADPSVQSGRPASILGQFRDMGIEIEPVFPIAVRPPAGWLVRKAFHRLARRQHRWDREPAYLSLLSREFDRRTAGKHVDLVFSPGSEAISHLQTNQPIAFCADATFANLVDYYEDFTRLSRAYCRQGHRQEAAALSRAALAVYPSDWAARSAIEFYGAAPERVAVIPFGANLGRHNRRDQVWNWIAARARLPLRLLFVGRNWRRKGGDIVVSAARSLIESGHSVELHVVGCAAPAYCRKLSWIRQHGLLQANNPTHLDELHRLFIDAHFMFVPSRAEAYGMTFAEGNAFGLPVVTTATGGIPSIVRHGWNGLLLSPSATATEYAGAIASSFRDINQYRQFCRQAFEEFEQRLNWRAFCSDFIKRAADHCHASN